MSIRLFCSIDDFLSRCSWLADSNILSDSVIEQIGTLRHPCDSLAPLGHRKCLEFLSIDGDAPVFWFNKAQKQVDNGTLASTAWPDKCDFLARGNGEADTT